MTLDDIVLLFKKELSIYKKKKNPNKNLNYNIIKNKIWSILLYSEICNFIIFIIIFLYIFIGI